MKTQDISIDEQIACVRREIGMRERVYPTWVDRKRMSAKQAENELTRMRAVLATLEQIKADRSTPDLLGDALNSGNGTYRP